MFVNIIVAYCKNNGIGINNSLPWSIKSDMKKFKDYTTGNGNNAVIMGKNTYNSIGKVLPNRDNLILTKTLVIDKLNSKNIIKTFNNIDILNDFIKLKKYDEVWIIGGEKIYNDFINSNKININKIYVTYIDEEYKCDTFFPKLNYDKYKFISQELHTTYDISNNKQNIYDIIYEKI